MTDISQLRPTRFYAIDLDRRTIRARQYRTETMAAADGNRLAFRGSHIRQEPAYASFSVVDEEAWAGG